MKINEKITDTYDVLEDIGSGSGGTVYKAYHKRLHMYTIWEKDSCNGANNDREEGKVKCFAKNVEKKYLTMWNSAGTAEITLRKMVLRMKVVVTVPVIMELIKVNIKRRSIRDWL